ncbi:MAG: hypothetical protein KKA90_05010 [Nanoarchaeota archaeon]|nr:hypothetical protein [Nanoarchaeota archaeon]
MEERPSFGRAGSGAACPEPRNRGQNVRSREQYEPRRTRRVGDVTSLPESCPSFKERTRLSGKSGSIEHVEQMKQVAEHITTIRALPELPFGVSVRISAIAAFLVPSGFSVTEIFKGFFS